MIEYVYSVASVFVVSMISLIGIFTIRTNIQTLKKFLILFISFSAGSMFGGVFFHLLPEAVEQKGFTMFVSISVLIGIIFSFILEKIIHWRHCHMPTTKTHIHHVGIMSLFGDTVHNFIDGIIIGVSFLASIPIGFATTISVIFHEIPQEIADFGVLLHSGFSKKRALIMNFITSLSAFLGLALSFAIGSSSRSFVLYLIPFAAGNFLYIAGSDLIPELHKESELKYSLLQLFMFIFGVIIMFGLTFLEL